MSTKPYGARYTRREFRNSFWETARGAQMGDLAFLNTKTGKEEFFSPSKAEELKNIETARVAAAVAAGKAASNAKRTAKLQDKNSQGSNNARVAAARAEAARVAAARAEAARVAAARAEDAARAAAAARATTNGRSSATAPFSQGYAAEEPFSQGYAATSQPPRGSTTMGTIVSGFSSLNLRPPPIVSSDILDGVEAYILANYPSEKIDNMNDRFSNNIADFFLDGIPDKLLKGKPIDVYKRSLGLEDFAVVRNTGGGNNDCLIISLLMGISPAYRKLSYNNKYKFARDFRMNKLISLIEADPRSLKLTPAIKAYIKSSQMLDDSVIPFLAHLFKINILQLEKYKSEYVQGQGTVSQPPSSALVTNPKFITEGDYSSGIIIINIGNSHYEIIRQNPNKYIFSYPELQALYDKVNNSPFLEYDPEGGVTNGFKETNIVYLRGNKNTPHQVKGRRFRTDTKIIEYYTLDNGKNYSPTNISATPFGTGGKRKTRRHRKTKRMHR